MDERLVKTGLPQHLEEGDIWSTKREGTFVVVSARPADWRGEDRDVYAHIHTWYTIRAANEHEQVLWDAAVAASSARKAQREALNAQSFVYDAATAILRSERRALDSYDDRWNPPADIKLTPEQVEVENAAIAARNSLRTQESVR